MPISVHVDVTIGFLHQGKGGEHINIDGDDLESQQPPPHFRVTHEPASLPPPSAGEQPANEEKAKQRGGIIGYIELFIGHPVDGPRQCYWRSQREVLHQPTTMGSGTEDNHGGVGDGAPLHQANNGFRFCTSVDIPVAKRPAVCRRESLSSPCGGGASLTLMWMELTLASYTTGDPVDDTAPVLPMGHPATAEVLVC